MTDRNTWTAAALNSAYDALQRVGIIYAPRSIRYVRPRVQTSFPRSTVRGYALLGELVRDEQQSPVMLISPAISTGIEVVTVVTYLMARHMTAWWHPSWPPGRLTAAEKNALFLAGFGEPYNRIIPTERVVPLISAIVAGVEETYGTFVSTSVPVTTERRATQTTRMLRAVCAGGVSGRHSEYILRISRTQAERGRPYCGVCTERMIVDWS